MKEHSDREQLAKDLLADIPAISRASLSDDGLLTLEFGNRVLRVGLVAKISVECFDRGKWVFEPPRYPSRERSTS